jgi:integrating conjugative element protein (TIGR03756 family)
LFPRTGWTIQHSAPKSSAIVSQRVGDIITRSGESHVYNGIPTTRIYLEDNKVTFAPADGIEENTDWYGWWQPLHPKKEKKCQVFGENDLATTSGWGGGRVSESGEYAYAMWRPYTCCERDDGVLIIIDWILYPGVN